MKLLHPAWVAFVMLAILTVVPKTAFADPHALFYTAIGQQQLFFNTLAALNQADYVEPAEDVTGTPPGQSREKRLEARTNAGFGEVENGALDASKTQLAEILTRNITLEGNDLFSTYQAMQFARESARRNATDELARIYCDRSLGRVGCSDDPFLRLKNTAFVSDPAAWEQEIIKEGVLGALFSGKEEDYQLRKDRMQDSNKLSRKIPRAYSRFIAALREKAQSSGNQGIVDAVESRLAKAASLFFFMGPDPGSYDHIIYNTTGSQDNFGNPILEADLDESWWDEPGKTNVGSLNYINRIFEKADQFDKLDVALTTELRQGAEYITKYQEYINQNGALADVALRPQYVTPCFDGLDNDGDERADQEDDGCHDNGDASRPWDYNRYKDESGNDFTITSETKVAEIQPLIEVPSHAKAAQAEALADTIGDIDQNLIYVPPEGEQTPGLQQLVGPKDESGGGAGAPGGGSPTTAAPSTAQSQVAGATTQAQNAQTQGRVLSSHTGTAPAYPDYSQYYRFQNQDARYPDTNPVAPHLEEGLTDSLKALTGDRYTGINASCGFCAYLDSLILSGNWTVIIQQINNES